MWTWLLISYLVLFVNLSPLSTEHEVQLHNLNTPNTSHTCWRQTGLVHDPIEPVFSNKLGRVRPSSIMLHTLNQSSYPLKYLCYAMNEKINDSRLGFKLTALCHFNGQKLFISRTLLRNICGIVFVWWLFSDGKDFNVNLTCSEFLHHFHVELKYQKQKVLRTQTCHRLLQTAASYYGNCTWELQ